MWEISPLIALVDFALYSPMGEIVAPRVDLAKMEADQQRGSGEDPLDQEVASCQFQDATLASFSCLMTSRRQIRNPRSATSAASEAVGIKVSL